MGCAGHPEVRTPHLDALAQSGMRFSHAFTPTPICVAARISMITGHRGSRTGFTGNEKLPGAFPEFPTLMTLLHARGYHTHGVGKMHFSGRLYGLQSLDSQEESPDYLIDDDYLLYLKAHDACTRFPHGYRDLLYYQPQTLNTPREHSPAEWVADRSIDFLRHHARYRGNRPFFLWSSFIQPHPPFAACEPYASMYPPETLALPYNTERPLAELPYPAWPHRGRLDGAHRDPEQMRRIRALYYGQVTQVDDCIGRVLGALGELGLTGETIIVFASDHGEMLGDHGLSQKNVPYEQSVRVPLLVRWPGVTRPGSISDDLVGLTDLLPTVLDGLRLEYPAECGPLPGASLLNVLRGNARLDRDAYYSDYGSGEYRWIAARTKTHKYTLYAAGGFEELYDLTTDPGECLNLAAERPELARHLRERVLVWEKQHGLRASFDGEDFRVYPQREPPSEAACRLVTINHGRWVERLPEDEQGIVPPFAVEFTRAISKEPSLSPGKLSLQQYKARGGDLTGTTWEEAWKDA